MKIILLLNIIKKNYARVDVRGIDWGPMLLFKNMKKEHESDAEKNYYYSMSWANHIKFGKSVSFTPSRLWLIKDDSLMIRFFIKAIVIQLSIWRLLAFCSWRDHFDFRFHNNNNGMFIWKSYKRQSTYFLSDLHHPGYPNNFRELSGHLCYGFTKKAQEIRVQSPIHFIHTAASFWFR